MTVNHEDPGSIPGKPVISVNRHAENKRKGTLKNE